ncbi:hypothetical protein [Aureispira anguillae]|uniref:Uncharacterized protein n=1 Tax=Aureispira anguillae TaxID=2864201 RepID=A0A915YJ23_9BACT|nr:hypothetical protein [Aureispira anguillae]BDS14099.1 hypothetical protein AsAng_0048660 [Aureispira anguillae]
MRERFKYSKRRALFMALFNITNQTLINPKKEFDIDSLINDAVSGFAYGGSLDIIESLSNSSHSCDCQLSKGDATINIPE